MKKILLSIILTMTVGLVMAQGFGPQAGDISVSLKLGKAENFSNLKLLYMYNGTYTIYSPSNTTASTSSNSIVNMIGVEGKRFLSSNIAVAVNFMGTMSNSPGQDAVEGVSYYDEDTYETTVMVPAYESVSTTGEYKFVGSIGADYYLSVGNDRIYPYVGGRIQGLYGRSEVIPIVDYEDVDTYAIDEQIAENYGLGGAVVGGIDYYIGSGIFLGFEVKVGSYLYSVSRFFPNSGLEAIEASNHSITFLSNPMFKIGFTF